MRSVIINSQTNVTTGRSRMVLKSREGVTRMALRGMRLFFEHPRDQHAAQIGCGKPAHLVADPGAALLSEPTGLDTAGPWRCRQLRRSLTSRTYAGNC